MANPHGFPIWYELLTKDAAASTAFYERVLGWTVKPSPVGAQHDYRQIDGASGAVGGMLQLTDQMCSSGARPTWLVYFGVDDVDAAVAKVVEHGGKVQLPAFDMPGVGRLAMVTDPQGIPFYVMRGASDGESKAWERTGMGKCNWNELTTSDQRSANDFYAKVLGWTYPDKMAMPGGKDYVFVAVAGTTIGATMESDDPKMPKAWSFYFRAPDIEKAVADIKEAGGTIHAGPMEVPGNDMVVVASDPHGVAFGVAAPKG